MSVPRIESFDVMPLSVRYLLMRASEPLTLDPPAWGAAPPDATSVIKRCHELRTKPLRDFTVEDLRIMIGQQVALGRMVALSLDRLQPDSLVENDFPGDLLASVLQVDAVFWEQSPDLDVEVRRLAERVDQRLELEPRLRELIKTFIQDHAAARRRNFLNSLSG
jgi:hypothetical protein